MIPGWGQVANGSWIKGTLFLGTYAGFIGWGISLNQDVQDAKGDPAFSSGQIQDLERSRNQKYGFAALTLLLAVAEAYIDAHLKGFNERIDADLGMIRIGDGAGWGMALTVAPGTSDAARSR